MARAFPGAPPNRAGIPIVDEDASASFFLCVRSDKRELLERLSPPGSPQ